MSYNETPREIARNTIDPAAVHQSIVLLVDTSGSMDNKVEDGSCKKIELLQQQINSIKNVQLSDAEKDAVDICVIAFDDVVHVVQGWCPLSQFEGVDLGEAAGCTSLGDALIAAVQATKMRRKTYEEAGILSKQAQIFMYTDAFSTQSMEACYEIVTPYLNRENPSAKLYTVLIPPAVDASDLAPLGNKVAILCARKCVSGLPATFEFLKASVVQWSQTAFGRTVTTALTAADGLVYKKGQGGIEALPNGTVVVIDEVAPLEDDDVWGTI